MINLGELQFEKRQKQRRAAPGLPRSLPCGTGLHPALGYRAPSRGKMGMTQREMKYYILKTSPEPRPDPV